MGNTSARRLLLVLTLTSVLLSPDCTTIARGRKQRIPVTSVPPGATVIVDGVEQGATPLEIKLARKKKGSVIRIESPGYQPVEIQTKRRFPTPNVIINVFMGGMVGYEIAQLISVASDHDANAGHLLILCVPAMIGSFLTVDTLSGSGYTIDPTDLYVTLSKDDGTSRVVTVIVDSDVLRNVKWIRVHRD